MRRGVQTALLALVFYAGLLWGSVALMRGPIEAELADRVEGRLAELAESGADLRVAFEGRDATLTGTVREPGQAAAAAAQVAALDGVRVVENKIEVKVPPEPASFAAERTGEGTWMIDGRVASRSEAARIEGSLRAALGDSAELAGHLTVDVDTEPAPWIDALEGWVAGYLGAVSGDAGLAVIDGKLLLAGEVYSEEARDAALAAARSAFAGSNLELGDELQRVDPPESPMLAIAPTGDGGLQLVGRLRDAQLRDRIVELVGKGAEGLPFSHEVAVGDHVAGAPWLAALVQIVPGLVAEVDGLQMAASDGVLLMAGTVGAPATKTALVQMAGQALEGFEVAIDDRLQVKIPPQPASLSIARGEDGTLTLGGMLAEVSLARPLVDAAQRACGQELELATEILAGDNVMEAPWVGELASLVGPFVETVRWGALSVHGEQVALEAEALDAEGGDALRALVENAFPAPPYRRVIEVRVAVPDGPSDEDIAALEKAVGSTVIYFKPGGSKLRPREGEKLKPLVEAFKKVPGVSLGLLGNEAEDGGQELAKARCVAVRDALEEMGVEFLLMEVETRPDPGADPDGPEYESPHRVEFELR